MTESYRILCAVDGSAGSETAIDLIGALPLRPADKVTVGSHPAYLFAARPGGGGPIARLAADARARAREFVDVAVRRLAAHGVDAHGLICEAGEDAVDAVLRCVEDLDASLLVVGSRGRAPWASILIGSTSRALAILSPVPVLVARTARAPIRVLAAVDGSPSSLAALRAFGALPQSEGCSVELFHVLPAHEWPTAPVGDPIWEEMGRRLDVEMDERDDGLDMLRRAKALLPVGIDSTVRQERGHVGQLILARASAMNADLIVVGTEGMSGRRQPFFGSTAERILTQTHANVLIARHRTATD